MWSVLQRDSEEEEFAVPEGWEVVEVNEDNFPQYVNQVWTAKEQDIFTTHLSINCNYKIFLQIGHLLNEATVEKMKKNLVRFILKGRSPSEDVGTAGEEKYQILRKTDEGDFHLPEVIWRKKKKI